MSVPLDVLSWNIHEMYIDVKSGSVEKLDQGHLYPDLEVPGLMSRPRIEHELPAWEASTLEKSQVDSLFAGYSEPLFELRLAAPPGLYSSFSNPAMQSVEGVLDEP
jgi:hypothetical protein